MTQSIPPVLASATSTTTTTTESQESSNSWWDTLVEFIFAKEQAGDPVEPLKEKKIMEIDPNVLHQVLRQKRLAEEKATEQPASAQQPEIAVDEKMRQVAKQRLDRLSSRLATVGERLAALEKTRSMHTQQVQGLKQESQKTLETLKSLRRGPRYQKQRGEIQLKVTEYEGEIAALNQQVKEVTGKKAQIENERVAIKAAMGQAQKVVDLLQNARVMPQELENLKGAAEAAELSLTKA